MEKQSRIAEGQVECVTQLREAVIGRLAGYLAYSGSYHFDNSSGVSGELRYTREGIKSLDVAFDSGLDANVQIRDIISLHTVGAGVLAATRVQLRFPREAVNLEQTRAPGYKILFDDVLLDYRTDSGDQALQQDLISDTISVLGSCDSRSFKKHRQVNRQQAFNQIKQTVVFLGIGLLTGSFPKAIECASSSNFDPESFPEAS